jgi:hypothetical protein
MLIAAEFVKVVGTNGDRTAKGLMAGSGEEATLSGPGLAPRRGALVAVAEAANCAATSR